MNTQAPTSPAQRPARRSHFGAVFAGTLATFLVLFTLLAHQLRTGHDPALLSNPAAIVAPGGHAAKAGGLHLVTTASGGQRLVGRPATVNGHPAVLPTLVTHSSGGHGADD